MAKALVVLSNYQHYNDPNFAPNWSPPHDLATLVEPKSKTHLLSALAYDKKEVCGRACVFSVYSVPDDYVLPAREEYTKLPIPESARLVYSGNAGAWKKTVLAAFGLA